MRFCLLCGANVLGRRTRFCSDKCAKSFYSRPTCNTRRPKPILPDAVRRQNQLAQGLCGNRGCTNPRVGQLTQCAECRDYYNKLSYAAYRRDPEGWKNREPVNWEDLTGQRFGLWKVLRYARRNRWLCICQCGTKKKVHKYTLKNKKRNHGCTSCLHTTHGGSATTEYTIWCGIKDRCFNPRTRNFHNYGGRGITMCQRWRESFPNFLADVGKRPSMKYTLDRKNNDGNYEPGNVRWATAKVQANNRRTNVRSIEEEMGIA